MSKFFQHLLVLLILSSISRAILLVDDECSTDRLSCPENSKCRPLSCRGYHCACDEGFMPDDNSTACIKGAALGQKCGSTFPPCLNANAVCLKGLISLSPPNCQCEKGYINANNLQCLVQTNYKRFGEWCEKKCGPTLSCKLGFCQCQLGYRQRTALEIQADPDYKYDCIQNEFSLSKCRGTDVLLMSGIDYHSLLNSISKTSTDPNANYTDTTLSINQTTESGNWTTTQYYNLTSLKADNVSLDSTTPTSITLPTSVNTSPSPTSIPTNVVPPDTQKIQTTMTRKTTLAMTTVSPSQSSPSNADENITNSLPTKFTSTSQSPTKTTKLDVPTTPTSAKKDITTSRIQKTSTLTIASQTSVTSSQTTKTQTTLNTQTPKTIPNIITTSVLISKSIPTQVTARVSSSSPTTTTVQVTSSSRGTTGAESVPPKPITTRTSHGSTSSSVTEKSTSLPTITNQSEATTKNNPTKTSPQTTPVLTTGATKTVTVDQNVTKPTTGNESAVTLTPVTQTVSQSKANSKDKVPIDAIVIPSVLVIVLAIVITSVIAVIVCRKRRSHISLSSDTDNSPYKVPRPSMTSQALTSAPSPPSPYNNGDNSSYHYVNDAFENDRL